MFGCLLALSRDWVAPFEKRMRLITALWLVMLAAVIFFTPQANFPTWALSLETLAVDITSVLAVWLASTSGTIISRILSAKPLIFLGNISYCLYAVHVPVIGSFGRGLNFGEAMGRMSPVGAVLYYLLAPLITACLISWLWTRAEEPIRKLRKQWRRTGKAKSWSNQIYFFGKRFQVLLRFCSKFLTSFLDKPLTSMPHSSWLAASASR